MIFIANTLILNGGTTFLRRISRAYHEQGHKVLILVMQGPVPVDTLGELRDISEVVMLDYLFSNTIPIKLHNNASIFIPFDKLKIKKMVMEYGSHIHVMGVFGLYCALRLAKLNKSVRISLGIYQQNEYFLRGRHNGIAAQMIDLFKRVPAENVINFNEYGVLEYSKIMGLNYLLQNIVPIGILSSTSGGALKPVAYKIISVGNLIGFKKYNEHVIRLLPKLLKKFPQIKYDIYGDGPERETLLELSKSLGLSECVTFHGLIPYAEFQAVVSTASVFVGSGTAILEAAMLGVPSIVGIELIAEPVTYGFIYDCEGYSYNEIMDSRRTVSIEAKLMEVFNGSTESIAQISEKCIKKANEFTIDKTFDGFLHVEEGLLPICNHLALIDMAKFSFWILIVIVLDYLKIDRSFRLRRDLA